MYTAKGQLDANTMLQQYSPLVRRLAQGAVPRDQFEVSFRGVAPDLTDLKLVSIRRPAELDFSGWNWTPQTLSFPAAQAKLLP